MSTAVRQQDGVLFILLLAALGRAGRAHGWSTRTMALGAVASLVPFGPFWFERQIPR